MSLDGSQRIEAKPRQDGGNAHSLKVSSRIVPLHPFSPYVLVMRAWLPLSWLGVLVLSLMSTSLFMHMYLASVDHLFIISGTYLE